MSDDFDYGALLNNRTKEQLVERYLPKKSKTKGASAPFL